MICPNLVYSLVLYPARIGLFLGRSHCEIYPKDGNNPDFFRKRHVYNSISLEKLLYKHFALELGYEFVFSKSLDVLDGDGDPLSTKMNLNGPYLSGVFWVPVTQKASLFAGAGGKRILVNIVKKISGNDDHTIVAKFSSKKFLPRVQGGLEYQVLPSFCVRLAVAWERTVGVGNMQFLYNRGTDTHICRLHLKNTVNYMTGLVFRL